LEIGGQSAEIMVVSTALRDQWKEARAALQTSRNMMAVLEAEYKESRECCELLLCCCSCGHAVVELLSSRMSQPMSYHLAPGCLSAWDLLRVLSALHVEI
jgi:hypothetical protein